MEKVIRAARQNDSRSIWLIRNHPTLRPWFNSKDEISFGDHDAWFKNNYFNKLENYCYVLEVDKVVIGYCRFDLRDEGFFVSIAFDPAYQNQGLGHELLSRAMVLLGTDREIMAEVYKDNTGSIKLFQKNNFAIVNQDESKIFLKLKK